MDDCGADLVPSGDDLLPEEHHAGFVSHMAAMHARFLGWPDTIGLADHARRFRYFAPELIAPELDVVGEPGPIAVANKGWAMLPERAPRLDELVQSVHADPEALVEALAKTPSTFAGGDWKLGCPRARKPRSRATEPPWSRTASRALSGSSGSSA